MCGILGFNWEDKALARRMAELLKHRGPDDSGFYFDRNISLGHRRLSIIDLSKKARNPIFNENKDVCVVFNGEIYNFKDIRKELQKKGHRFYSNTDSEVVVHAYEEYALDFVNHFNGMFAFALYDMKKKQLVIARDRLGIKPLHYYYSNNKLIFASEIKAILAHNIRRKLNLNALNKFLHFNYILGEDTLFEGIRKLPPAHLLLYDIKTKKMAIKQYWDVEINETNKPESYYVKQIIERLKESVKKRLISDVPLGLFLSGGIDSTMLLALMKELKKTRIKTYSVGFNEPWDEIHDARKVSKRFGTDHHEIYVESDVLKQFPEFIWHMDTPKTNISPQYFVAKLAKKTVTVALAGLGGDELFAGYRRHKYYYLQQKLSKIIPRALGKPLFSTLTKLPLKEYHKRGLKYLADIHDKEKTYTIGVPLLVYDEDREELFAKKMLKLKQPEDYVKYYFKSQQDPYHFYNQCLKMEIKTYIVDDLLERMDRMSMASSVEARVPFLDHTFVEFAFSIPFRYKRFDLGEKAGKYLLIQAAKKKIPKFVIEKRKIGFNMSPYYWFKGSLKEHASNILTKKTIQKRGLFRYGFIKKILDKKPTQEYYYHYQTLWNMMAFEIWHQMYLDKKDLKPKKNIEAYYA